MMTVSPIPPRSGYAFAVRLLACLRMPLLSSTLSGQKNLQEVVGSNVRWGLILGSGLLPKERSLVIIVMILLVYIGEIDIWAKLIYSRMFAGNTLPLG
jgi:hypothetical protein